MSDMPAAASLIRPQILQPLPRNLPREVDIFGAGRAVRAMLTVAALQGSTMRFRIWCRHEARAELLRVHLADLPALAVEIIVADQPPPGGSGPVVLALGLRTSRRSRQKSKDALFGENLAIIDALMPALAGRSVIVVTNPCTRLTALLCGRGIDAFGIGVMNDQLRFERDAPAEARLVGAHNPFELAFGWLGEAGMGPLGFSRAAYRDLTNRQDRQRPLLDPDGWMRGIAPALHESAWRDLGRLHDGLDIAKRWYARQRLASRYLENGIACGRAILLLADAMSGQTCLRPDLTIEAPMRIGEAVKVLGWPCDAITGQPRALNIDDGGQAVLAGLAGAQDLSAGIRTEPRCLMLRGEGKPVIACTGEGLEALTPDVEPLAQIGERQGCDADIDIVVTDDPGFLPETVPGVDAPALHVAQHRGKNAFEHRDLTIQPLPGQRRLASFSMSGARALIDDAARQITLAAPPGPGRRDEFRKLLRDQILVPAQAAAGAWVLHAGLVSHNGAGLLLLGGSGAGKTTGALHLLARRQRDGQIGGYGASERVLLSLRGGQLAGLGVPESLTIFRGSLRGLPSFADLVEGNDPADDWTRSNKLRLSRDEVVARLGSRQIAAPLKISHVALLSYQPRLPSACSTTAVTDAATRTAALQANDMTTMDDVRAAWLGWFEPVRDAAVVPALASAQLPFVEIAWREPSALADALQALAAGVTRDGPGSPEPVNGGTAT